MCWVVRKNSMKDKFGLGLEGYIRSTAERGWEDHSDLHSGQSEAWRWGHARCILGHNCWSNITKEEKFFVDLIYTI